ncbi:hypothetical protein HDU89_007643 [Geranomyces variabilis]|nr:hypothetical protein HDU89_007643 [Geranomyces variabilis]
MTAPCADPFQAACLSLSLLHSQGYLALLESSTPLVRQRYDLLSSVPASSATDPFFYFQWEPVPTTKELVLLCDPLRDVSDDEQHRTRLRFSSYDAETCRASLPFTVGERTGAVVVERVVEAAGDADGAGDLRWAYFDCFEIPVAPEMVDGWLRERGWRETIDEARAAGVDDAGRRARDAMAALPAEERGYWEGYDASLIESEDQDGKGEEQAAETESLAGNDDDYWAAYESSAALPSY